MINNNLKRKQKKIKMIMLNNLLSMTLNYQIFSKLMRWAETTSIKILIGFIVNQFLLVYLFRLFNY